MELPGTSEPPPPADETRALTVNPPPLANESTQPALGGAEVTPGKTEEANAEIVKHAKIIRELEQQQREIEKLQEQRDQLMQHLQAKARAEQTQNAIRKAEALKEKLNREILRLQRINAEVIHDDNEDDQVFDGAEEDDPGEYDTTSPLSKELQLHPWPVNYKASVPAYDGKKNPRKFIASYETAIYSAGGDAQTLAKSLILAVEDIAHDWYTSLKPMSIRSWHQLR